MNSFYNNFRQNQEQRSKSEEIRDRSFGEQMMPVVIAGTISKGLIHILSFGGAVILPAYGFDLLFGSFYIGLLFGFVAVFVFIELPKWSVVNTISENYFNSGIISYGLGLLALVFIIPSIASSTYGVPIAVFWLSPDAELISLVDIENKHNFDSEKALSRYEPQIKKHSNDATTYFNRYKKWYAKEGEKGRYRLPSHKLSAWKGMDKAGKEVSKALNSRLDSIQSYRERDTQEAKSLNGSTTSLHTFKKQHAGNIAFWVMLCLELCYVLIVFGLGYIKYRSRLELEGIEPNRTETGNIIDLRTESNHIKPDQPASKQAVAKERTIGFDSDQHGKIFTPQGATKPRVTYQKADGSFTEYTKADLFRLHKKDTGSVEFKEEINRLIKTMD